MNVLVHGELNNTRLVSPVIKIATMKVLAHGELHLEMMSQPPRLATPCFLLSESQHLGETAQPKCSYLLSRSLVKCCTLKLGLEAPLYKHPSWIMGQPYLDKDCPKE
jgi:hypothetical protein